MECGGNLFDAVSLAAKAALFNTRIPKVTAAVMDAGEADLLISDDPYNCTRIQIDNIPILVTVCKIGDCCVVDPSAEEEQCSTASLVVAVSKRNDKCTYSCIFNISFIDDKHFQVMFHTLIRSEADHYTKIPCINV